MPESAMRNFFPKEEVTSRTIDFMIDPVELKSGPSPGFKKVKP